jgi:hypothetical protein
MTEFSYTARVRVPEHVLVQELDGEAVLLNLKNETYFGLDAVGMHMWQILTTFPSIQDAYDLLLSDYEVQPRKLQQDLDDLLGKLVEQGLVVVSNE